MASCNIMPRRTTLTLDDAVDREIRRLAFERGTSVKALTNEAGPPHQISCCRTRSSVASLHPAIFLIRFTLCRSGLTARIALSTA